MGLPDPEERRAAVISGLMKVTFSPPPAQLKELLGKSPKDGEISREYTIAVMWCVTQAIGASYRDAEEEKVLIQDGYHKAIYERLGSDGWPEEALTTLEGHIGARYKDYYEAYAKRDDPGPTYWLGKAVVVNLGVEPDAFNVHWAAGFCHNTLILTKEFLDKTQQNRELYGS